MGRPASGPTASPYTSLDETIRGRQARGMSNRRRMSASHCSVVDVHELRAAGVGHVGDVEPSARPAGQVPDEPGIDRAEQGVAGLRLLARTGDVGEQPMQLEAGKIARQRQAGLGAQAILAAVGREARHQVVDARVLPDERVAERLAGAPIPQKRGLALVRDADRGEVADG